MFSPKIATFRKIMLTNCHLTPFPRLIQDNSRCILHKKLDVWELSKFRHLFKLEHLVAKVPLMTNFCHKKNPPIYLQGFCKVSTKTPKLPLFELQHLKKSGVTEPLEIATMEWFLTALKKLQLFFAATFISSNGICKREKSWRQKRKLWWNNLFFRQHFPLNHSQTHKISLPRLT